MAFIKFENRKNRYEDRITLTRSNSMGFPAKFYKENGISGYKYAVLFWDPEEKAIGIGFTNEEAKNSNFSITHSKQGYGGTISAKSFFRHHSIDPKIYHGRYNWQKVKDPAAGEIFVIKLKEANDSKEK